MNATRFLRAAALMALGNSFDRGIRQLCVPILQRLAAERRATVWSQGDFFSRAGYVVLAIDYRTFGRSGGEVRGELFPDR